MHLHISNLGQQITEASLWATFATYGSVTDVEIMTGAVADTQENFGLVHMPHAREAIAAIARLNGSIINGKMVAVKENWSKVNLVN